MVLEGEHVVAVTLAALNVPKRQDVGGDANGSKIVVIPFDGAALDRGVVAVNQGDGKVFVSWRLLGTEPDSIGFNVYRTTGGGQLVKLNREPLTKATCYLPLP